MEIPGRSSSLKKKNSFGIPYFGFSFLQKNVQNPPLTKHM